ncbi:response regulator transcription factor [Pelomicrobium methylotrophicum]|uniref:Phosphate regulon transcriptional regulatory protein PhoB n=1 Tax=Pelomicrobium methylotrophicum TaxID=2602750 RepID=A0A5C7EE88_9PROT|nr:response regulator transcription factor [Pelomicrobium methylotrophicum]TXF10468.1 response regulator transcription factor [Pelomicrobium methylotrophicum]
MGREVLVVEDHPNIARLVKLHVQELGCEVDLAFDGPSGLARAQAKAYAAIILERVLPGLDGLEVCRRLREAGNFAPILMLTAKRGEAERVRGLNTGVDDYLAKPFSVAELQSRVKALMRRAERCGRARRDEAEMVRVGALELDEAKRRVRVRGREVELTSREFELLLQLARNPGRVFTRSQLLDRVWSYDYAGHDHTVKSHINRLRAKIEDDPAHPRYILTVWGAGYKFTDEPPE